MFFWYDFGNNSSEVNAAIISGVVSLIIGLFTIIGWVLKFRQETENQKKKLEVETEKLRNETNLKFLEIKNKYSEKLLSKRMDIYPELLKITQDIGKNNWGNGKEIRQHHEEMSNQLKEWQTKNGGTLFMKPDTYDAFKKLQNILKLENLSPDKNLDKEKLDSIWKKRNRLRNLLKQELNILHDSEINFNKELA
jgi:uncharacterized protein YwqG